MPLDPGAPQFNLLLGGAALEETTLRYVISIELQESVEDIDAVTIKIALPENVAEVQRLLKIAQPFTVTLNYGVAGAKQVTGDIVEITYGYGARGRYAALRGLDSLYKLKQKRVTRHWNVPLPQIVTMIAQEHGLTASPQGVDATPRHEFQDNESNAAFLTRLARLYHYSLGAKEGILSFTRLTMPTTYTISGPISLIDFEVTQSLNEIPTRVVVRGWDYRQNRAVVGTSMATQLARYSGGKLGAEIVQTFMGEVVLEVDNAQLTTETACTAYALALHQRKAEQFIRGSATLPGKPEIVSGGKVNITGIGPQSGYYLVRGTTHTLDGGGGYRTKLQLCSDSLCPQDTGA